jgi:pseudaminic acid synthase
MTNSFGFSREVRIGKKVVGPGHPTYIIAEIGANFDRNLDKAKLLVKAAKDSGADCAKFQSFLADRIVSRQGFARMQLKGVHGSWGRPVDEVFKDAEFPREWHREIAEYCNDIGIDFSTSPYDFEAVDLCDQLNVPFIKIGSGEITWPGMLKYVAAKKRPIILATGDSTLSEVDDALRIFEDAGVRDVILLQCITNYPSKIESANIRVLQTYQTAFNILTGYSDHSPGVVVALGSVALGAVVIEKHFTISKKDAGPDHPHSMEHVEFREMVRAVRELEEALGSTHKRVVEEEAETVIVQRRGLYARKRIAEGACLTDDHIVELRPAIGISPKHREFVVGRTAKRAIEAGDPIFWSDL